MNVAIYINRDGTFECDVTGGRGTKCKDVTDQITPIVTGKQIGRAHV